MYALISQAGTNDLQARPHSVTDHACEDSCNMTPQLTVHSNIAPLAISCTGQGQLAEAATLRPNGKVTLDAFAKC